MSGSNGDTALHLAVVRNSTACVRALLVAGSGVELQRRNAAGWTALHFAVSFGVARLDVLREILTLASAPAPARAGAKSARDDSAIGTPSLPPGCGCGAGRTVDGNDRIGDGAGRR